MGVMKHDDPMDEMLARALREVDVVPEAPREEMWAQIQARRAARTADVIPLRPRTTRTWVPWSAAIAATLVLGIGLGRVSKQTATTPVVETQPVAANVTEETVPTAYRLAAAKHMQRTEALLATLSMEGGSGVDQMTQWARDLLTDTRILLTSPASEDPAMRRLLEDLELVLAQIAAIPGA